MSDVGALNQLVEDSDAISRMCLAVIDPPFDVRVSLLLSLIVLSE